MYVICFSIFLALFATGQNKKTIKISPKELASWPFYGQGTIIKENHGQVFLKEDPNGSKGIMLVSPRSYSTHVVIRYKVMSLTPMTVLVNLLSVSEEGKTELLNLDNKYDGNLATWRNEKESYFFAFCNASHNYPPFIRKFPIKDPHNFTLDMAKENIMMSGKYYNVEVGRKKALIWLKINGKTILKAKDPKPLQGGHIAFRIRGTATEYAACLIKDVEITEN